jgi:2,4-dienoyl-CoA reductase (NADPH2)
MGSMQTDRRNMPDSHEHMAAFMQNAQLVQLDSSQQLALCQAKLAFLKVPRRFFKTAPASKNHHIIIGVVHEAGGKVCLQILRTGRYSRDENPIARSWSQQRSS